MDSMSISARQSITDAGFLILCLLEFLFPGLMFAFIKSVKILCIAYANEYFLIYRVTFQRCSFSWENSTIQLKNILGLSGFQLPGSSLYSMCGLCLIYHPFVSKPTKRPDKEFQLFTTIFGIPGSSGLLGYLTPTIFSFTSIEFSAFFARQERIKKSWEAWLAAAQTI